MKKRKILLSKKIFNLNFKQEKILPLIYAIIICQPNAYIKSKFEIDNCKYKYDKYQLTSIELISKSIYPNSNIIRVQEFIKYFNLLTETCLIEFYDLNLKALNVDKLKSNMFFYARHLLYDNIDDDKYFEVYIEDIDNIISVSGNNNAKMIYNYLNTYFAIMSYMTNENYAYPNFEDIKKILNVSSKSSVSRYIKFLSDNNIIKFTNIGCYKRGSNIIKFSNTYVPCSVDNYNEVLNNSILYLKQKLESGGWKKTEKQ